jgi:hypothetical protein
MKRQANTRRNAGRETVGLELLEMAR